MITNDTKLQRISLIAEALSTSVYRIGESEVTLKLIELKTDEALSCGYAVLAESLSEQVLCLLGCSLNNCQAIFSKLADGQVSPCNLHDVVEDMMYSFSL